MWRPDGLPGVEGQSPRGMFGGGGIHPAGGMGGKGLQGVCMKRDPHPHTIAKSRKKGSGLFLLSGSGLLFLPVGVVGQAGEDEDQEGDRDHPCQREPRPE